MTHVEMIEDSRGDLIDVWYFCSAVCFTEDTGKGAHGHAYPCPSWPDYDTHCHNCGALLHAGGVGMSVNLEGCWTYDENGQRVKRPGLCQWFALCDNPANGTVSHPILGAVPTCQRCADKLDLDLLPSPPV